MASNSIKFTGLASGMDTESIVTAMVAPYKAKVDNSKKQSTLLEWKKDAYKEISSKMYDFYTKTAGKLRLESTFNKKNLTMSNNNAIQLTAGSTANAGTHIIDKIDQMAKNAQVATKRLETTDGSKVDNNTELQKLGFEAGDVISFSEGIKDKDGKLVTKKIAFVDKITDDMKDEDTIYLKIGADSGNSQIKDLNAALKKALPNSNVSFNETVGAFFISSKSTGENEQIAMEASRADSSKGTGKDVLSALGMKTDIATTAPGDNKSGSFISEGQDENGAGNGVYGISAYGQSAVYSYNGIDGIKSDSNNVDIGGLKFTINDTTTEAITITSTDDVDGIMTTIKEFVDEYNKLIEDLNGKINADSAKGYEPLTDEQKEAMSDKEIEKWEQKIKDSLFRNDSTLKSVTSSMRDALNGVFAGNTFGSLAAIGITTGSYTENGKLYIDEDKLKAALTKDSDAVIQLLAGSGDPEEAYKASTGKNDYSSLTSSEQAKWKTKTTGIFDRLYDNLKGKFNSVANVKTSTSLYNDLLWNKNITNQAKETDKWQERLEKMEDMYYKKFAAMEKLMSTMNSQTSSLTALFGGGQ